MIKLPDWAEATAEIRARNPASGRKASLRASLFIVPEGLDTKWEKELREGSHQLSDNRKEFVASHPCDRKKSHGWGTGSLWTRREPGTVSFPLTTDNCFQPLATAKRLLTSCQLTTFHQAAR